MFNPSKILTIGLGFTFLANAIGALFEPATFQAIIEHSLIYHNFLSWNPLFVYFIVINDLIIAFCLINDIKVGEISAWAFFWLIGVITVFLSQGTLDGVLTAIEHGAPMGIALYIAIHTDH